MHIPADGVIVRQVPEKLQLEIVSADPRLVYDGTSMIVTIRLKNLGDQSVLVPWETPPIEPEPDAEGTTSYESVSIDLTLGTLNDREKKSYLKGKASLVATPNNRSQHMELLSGQWVDLKLRAVIECATKGSWPCQRFRADEHAQLIATWWEMRYSHGCKMDAAFKSRTLESAPLEVVYVTSTQPDQKPSPSLQ